MVRTSRILSPILTTSLRVASTWATFSFIFTSKLLITRRRASSRLKIIKHLYNFSLNKGDRIKLYFESSSTIGKPSMHHLFSFAIVFAMNLLKKPRIYLMSFRNKYIVDQNANVWYHFCVSPSSLLWGIYHGVWRKFDLFMLKDNMMCYAVISSTIIIFISPQKQSPTTNHCAYVQLWKIGIRVFSKVRSVVMSWRVYSYA